MDLKLLAFLQFPLTAIAIPNASELQVQTTTDDEISNKLWPPLLPPNKPVQQASSINPGISYVQYIYLPNKISCSV